MKDLIGIHTDLYNYKTIMICRNFEEIKVKTLKTTAFQNWAFLDLKMKT